MEPATAFVAAVLPPDLPGRQEKNATLQMQIPQNHRWMPDTRNGYLAITGGLSAVIVACHAACMPGWQCECCGEQGVGGQIDYYGAGSAMQ